MMFAVWRITIVETTATKGNLMYTVNGTEFASFLSAVAFAKSQGAEVFEKATGLRRWTPGKISAKSVRYFKEQTAAYKAKQKASVK